MPAPNKPNTAAATAAAAAKRAQQRADREKREDELIAADLRAKGYVVFSEDDLLRIIGKRGSEELLGSFFWGYKDWPGSYVPPEKCPSAMLVERPSADLPDSEWHRLYQEYDHAGHDHAACLRKIIENGTKES